MKAEEESAVSDQGQRSPDPDLERELRELGKRLEYPPAPDVTDRVLGRIRGGAARTGGRRWGLPASPWRRAVAAALVVVLAVASVLGISPQARTAAAEWLGLGGVKITFLPSTPEAEPVGADLRLGKKVSLEEARERVPYRILVPDLPKLGEPDTIYVGEPPPGGQVSLVYRPRPGIPRAAETRVGLLLTQFRGQTGRIYFEKSLGPGMKLENVRINGGRGYWIEGALHVFVYEDANKNIQEEKIRLAANTLIWEQGELTLRLEGKLSKEEALRIAESVR